MVTQRAPQSRRLHEEFEPDLALKCGVLGRGVVAADCIGDVRTDVEGGGYRRPVARAFLAGDRAPGKGCACESEQPGPFPGEAEGRVAPVQGISGGLRCRVGQDGQDEGLGVPEGMPVVAWSR